jgi:predicted membrane-bound mannosyltransferase
MVMFYESLKVMLLCLVAWDLVQRLVVGITGKLSCLVLLLLPRCCC